MHISSRRRSILIAGFLIFSTSSWTRRGLATTPPPVSDVLLADAVAFIERRYVRHGRRVVYNPVSTMQREFGLGFQIAGALVKALETAQIWCVSATSTSRQATLVQDPAEKKKPERMAYFPPSSRSAHISAGIKRGPDSTPRIDESMAASKLSEPPSFWPT